MRRTVAAERLKRPPLLARGFPELPRVVGYARVSTEEQSLDMQTAALRRVGVVEWFVEKVSAVNAKRPQFHLMMKFLERGDTLVLYALSRLARDLKTLLAIVDDLKARGVKLLSVTEPNLDPYTANGRFMLSINGAVDQHEREKIRERTRDGMAERMRQGQRMGRPRKVSAVDAMAMRRLRKSKTMTVEEIARKYGVATPTVYNYTSASAAAAR